MSDLSDLSDWPRSRSWSDLRPNLLSGIGSQIVGATVLHALQSCRDYLCALPHLQKASTRPQGEHSEMPKWLQTSNKTFLRRGCVRLAKAGRGEHLLSEPMTCHSLCSRRLLIKRHPVPDHQKRVSAHGADRAHLGLQTPARVCERRLRTGHPQNRVQDQQPCIFDAMLTLPGH